MQFLINHTHIYIIQYSLIHSLLLCLYYFTYKFKIKKKEPHTNLVMDKINPVSVGGLIVMGIKSASLTSLLSIILLCMVLCWVIELHDDFYSSILQPTLDFFLYYVTRKRYAKDILTPSNENYKVDERILMLRGEVELVMERLGVFCNPNGDKLQERFGWEDIASLFSEKGSSLEEEVKQAFDLFDENNDGYIDEKELEKVLWKLGFQEFSERECQRMIKVYDDNRDGLIDFSEFCKLVEDSFR